MRSPLLEPMFVSVAAAAEFLGAMYERMYVFSHRAIFDARYLGRRRLVNMAGVRAYAERPRSHVGGGVHADKVEPMYLSIPDAAEYLAISIATLRHLLDEQKIDNRYLGKRRVVSLESLQKFGESLPIDSPQAHWRW